MMGFGPEQLHTSVVSSRERVSSGDGRDPCAHSSDIRSFKKSTWTRTTIWAELDLRGTQRLGLFEATGQPVDAAAHDREPHRVWLLGTRTTGRNSGYIVGLRPGRESVR